MIRTTIDTSVLAPAIRRANQPAYALAPLLRAWRERQFELVVSEHILDELRRTLATPYFSRYLSDADREAAVALFRTEATLVEITVTINGVATHPEDDVILATAVSGQADYLVTGDAQLLRLGVYEGVTIVTARAFLGMLQQGDQP